MPNIDRRALRNLDVFTLAHKERYSSLESYHSVAADFRELVHALLPGDWKRSAGSGIWSQALPPAQRPPAAGFKIHLSTVHDKAQELLSAVVPVLVEEAVSFKHLVDAYVLDLCNSHTWSGGACGKFITAYPADLAQFIRVLDRLHEATKNFTGPYILSDRRYKDSKVLFYRYGGFSAHQRLNLFGESEAVIVGAGGQVTADPRLPYFVLPDGVADPFPDTEEASGEPVDEPVIKGRYKALSALASTSKGGVYQCLDLKTQREVIVKEARPLVNRGRRNPHDAVACLHNEHRVLQRLVGTGVVPAPLALFQDWEHTFLVMDVARGANLTTHMATVRDFSIILQREPSTSAVRLFCQHFLDLTRKILAGMRAIHACGVVIQDVSPRNIMYDRDADRVTFIDFESAYLEESDGEKTIVRMFTPGFGTAGHSSERPTRSEDYRALSNLMGDLLYPPTAFFTLAPQLRKSMLSHIAKERGLPDAMTQLIFGVAEQADHPETFDALFAAAERSIAVLPERTPPAPARDPDELCKVVARIASYIEAAASGADPLDLPTDYRSLVTNRLNVAYGAAGIALFLKQARGAVPERFLHAFVAATGQVDNQKYPPGLYMGSAGIAWTLLELGFRSEAEALLATAARSPLLFDSADLFYGAAGWGLTNLFFHQRLGDVRYLQDAIAASARIQSQLSKDQRGSYYVNMGEVYAGLAHGASGIGYFLLRLYEATGDPAVLACARELIAFELASADEIDGEIAFRRSADENLHYPYQRIGSAGIGSVAIRFHAALSKQAQGSGAEISYLDFARRIARSLRGTYTISPTNLYGMAGLANFFIDMFQYTREEEYRTEARRYVDKIMLFAIEQPTGLAFPGEDLVRICTDYATGSAGIGDMLHRLTANSGSAYLDF